MNTAILATSRHIRASKPALAMAAPMSPPTSACDELDGRPHHQVIRFQTIAPTERGEDDTVVDDRRASTSPCRCVRRRAGRRRRTR